MPDRQVSIGGILQMIRENRSTRADLAVELGVNPDQLSDRLALMVRQGYLARVDADVQGTRECSCACCGQPCAGNAASPARYRLTAKGRRVASLERDPLTPQVLEGTG